MKVRLYDLPKSEEILKYAVIISFFERKWVFCRHKRKTTYEIPGGHREAGETIEEAASRELQEETGAVEFRLKFMSDYSVEKNDSKDYGRVYVANILQLGKLPDKEIGEVIVTDKFPKEWTYPEIQPKFIEYYLNKYKR